MWTEITRQQFYVKALLYAGAEPIDQLPRRADLSKTSAAAPLRGDTT
jgi:hypothetical protein